ncbi:MAG: hypothetical protein SF070_13940 [Gemmatimonadota bacterium]|nr:hypothetical protein [Gemmatimonadota bacterium]
MSYRVVAPLAITLALNAVAPRLARAQEPCPPFQRPRGQWGPWYQKPDTLFILNFPLVEGDPSIQVGADGIIWTYEGKVLAVRWERTTLTQERLAGFLAAHRARLLGALPDSERTKTTCVMQFPVAATLSALDSLAEVVRRWPGVLSAEPVRTGRAGRPLPADATHRP